MARVPTITQGGVATRPVSTPLTNLKLPDLSGEARSLAQGGQALKGLGDELGAQADRIAAADARITKRRENNDRVRIKDAATVELQREFDREQNEGSNFTLDKNIQIYNDNVSKIITDAAASAQNHGAESQFILAGSLESLLFASKDKGVTAGIAALEADQERVHQDFKTGLGLQATTDPELVNVLRDQAEQRLAETANVDTPQETEVKRDEYYEAIAMGAFGTHMALSEFTKARKVLNGQRKHISPEKMTQSLNRLIVAEVQFFKQTGNKLHNLKPGEKLFNSSGKLIASGAPLASEKDAKPIILKPGETAFDADGKEIASGGPVTEKAIDKPKPLVLKPGETAFDDDGKVIASGADIEDKPLVLKPGEKVFDDDGKVIAENDPLPEEPKPLLGRGVKGRATELLTAADENGATLLDRYARGQTNSAEDQITESMIALTVTRDETTGQRSVMPPAYQEALRARGRDPAIFGDPSFPPVSPPTLEAPPSAPEPPTEATPAEAETPESAPDDFSVLLGGRSIAEVVMQEDFTGPSGALKRGIGRLPLVGEGAGFSDTIASNISLAEERLVTALQQNPRFAVTERKQLQDKINLEPSLIDNPKAMLGRLAGVALFLSSLENELTVALKKVQPTKQRQADIVSLRLIQDFRERLAPPIIASTDDAEIQKQLLEFAKESPPGSPVLALDRNQKWELYFTPGEAAQ